jgi:ATP-dependent protease ClpP protease subunit
MPKGYVLFFKSINPETATSCLHGCRSLMATPNQPPCTEIILSMTSGGGDVIAGVGLYNELKGMEVKLHTHNSGAIDSAAILPFMSGAKRTASKYSAFFFHQLHWTFASKDQLAMGTITDVTKWLGRYEAMMSEIVAEHSSLKPAEVLQMMRNGTSMSSVEALDHGLIHAIEETTIPIEARSWQA